MITLPLPRIIVLSLALAAWPLPGSADQDAAANALTDILFDMDIENVSYSLRPDGFVDITFGSAVPQDVYLRAVERLRNEPAIPGVLAGRGTTNDCPIP